MFIKPPSTLEEEFRTITVIVTGGGTGGHIYPAISITEKLKRDIDIENVIYIGCVDSLEERIAEEYEIDFLPIRFKGMPRKFSFALLKWLFALNNAVSDSLGYIHYVKPDIVVGTGGYVSAPVLIAALILNVPYIIHEADANPGLVNRVMSSWAAAISVAFEKAKIHLKNKNVHFLGNPLRSSIGEYTRGEASIFMDLNEYKKTLLVVGGSQGAKKINEAIVEALPILINQMDLQIIHQCGPKNYEELFDSLSDEFKNNPSYILKGYFKDMAIPLACSDLAVSRAGSLFLSELTASMLPSILVPYPYAAANHQKINALAMEEAGAAFYLDNEDCTADNIIKTIKTLLDQPEKLDYMRLACNRLSKKNATKDIIQLIKTIAKPKKKQKDVRQAKDL